MVHKLIPMPQAMKIPDAKAAVENCAADESQKQKRGDRRSKEWGQNRTLCIGNGSLSSQEFGVGAAVPKIQMSSYSEVTLWKMIQGLVQNSLNKGSSASQLTAAKVMDMISRLPGCAGQAADAVSGNTQVKMEDSPSLLKKFRSQNVQIFGYVYQNTTGQNHGPVWKIQSFLLSEIFTVILSQY